MLCAMTTNLLDGVVDSMLFSQEPTLAGGPPGTERRHATRKICCLSEASFKVDCVP